jgi:hypothetical protein
MSKKTKIPKIPSTRASKRRKQQLGRAAVALTTAMTAGMVLAPTGADAALTTGPDKPAYESAMAGRTTTALRDILRVHPKSEMAKTAFVQLAALCGGDSGAERDLDCTGGIAADATSDPPEHEPTDKKQIY